MWTSILVAPCFAGKMPGAAVFAPVIWCSDIATDNSQMLHVWFIYLQNWVIFGANVGKYSIYGAYGIVTTEM